MPTDSLAQSLVEAAAEAARKAFHEAVVGYVAYKGPDQKVYTPDEIHLVFTADEGEPGLWERVAGAALGASTAAVPDVARRLLFEHADKLMAAAADLYRSAGEIRRASGTEEEAR
jgi:hypothetical protein